MCIQNLVKLCPFILKILSGNEILTSIKGHNSVANLQRNMLNNPNLDVINLMCIQNLVKFCPLVPKKLSRNEMLTSNKGCNFVVNLQKINLNNPNLDIINVNLYTKFG